MVFDTYKEAVASMRNFTPSMRAAHKIVKFWSSTTGRYRFTRVLV